VVETIQAEVDALEDGVLHKSLSKPEIERLYRLRRELLRLRKAELSELLLRVQAQLDLHPLAIEDAAKAHQYPKAERYGARCSWSPVPRRSSEAKVPGRQ
jgi:Mg2+ and Co2+ transporter CorA